jgi:hypothetical protein
MMNESGVLCNIRYKKIQVSLLVNIQNIHTVCTQINVRRQKLSAAGVTVMVVPLEKVFNYCSWGHYFLLHLHFTPKTHICNGFA